MPSLLARALAVAGILSSSGFAQVRCGVAKDLVVQALENLKSNPGSSELEDGIQLLKQAAQACPTLGDAWYYRSLFEAKLGHKAPADFALRQARVMGSDALDTGIDPFQLAAPPDNSRIAANQPVREKWALVIGIGRFEFNIDMLPYTKKDAQDFADLLSGRIAAGFARHEISDLFREKIVFDLSGKGGFA